MNVLFIDSGIGGLTVLAQTVHDIPNLNYIYFADSEFAPYGNKTPQQITNRLKSIIETFKNQINLVVLACNTATACSINKLRQIFPFHIIGTEPAIKPATNLTKNILLVCTNATSKSKRLKALISNCQANVKIFSPIKLASYIDNFYLTGNRLANLQINRCINKIATKAKTCGCIVLGCTHYIFLSSKLTNKINLPVLDGNFGIKEQIKRYICDKNISDNPNQQFIVSSKNANLAKKYQIIFSQTLAKLLDV